MVEGARLEIAYSVLSRIVGSNPTRSASLFYPGSGIAVLISMGCLVAHLQRAEINRWWQPRAMPWASSWSAPLGQKYSWIRRGLPHKHRRLRVAGDGSFRRAPLASSLSWVSSLAFSIIDLHCGSSLNHLTSSQSLDP